MHIEAARSEAVARYALGSLRRTRAAVRHRLSVPDRAALDLLLEADGPHGIRHWQDLAMRTERTVWAARRA